MRVLKLRSSGRIIESQSGEGDLAVLLRNAIAGGYAERDVVALEIPDAEFRVELVAQMEAEKTAAQKRAEAYPSVQEQLDALWAGGAEADAMRNRIRAVQQQHPGIIDVGRT